MTQDSGGNVGIGERFPAFKLDVNGALRVTSCTGCSDARFKTSIEPVPDALSLIARLRPVRFDWRRDEFPEQRFSADPQIGLIAQESCDVAPEVVAEGSDGYLSVDYGRLTPLLIGAVQEQQRAIREQERRVGDLAARLEAVERSMSERTAGK